jgi:hypothetical protein
MYHIGRPEPTDDNVIGDIYQFIMIFCKIENLEKFSVLLLVTKINFSQALTKKGTNK